MHDLVVGDELDQYRLTELLARSGMASIFKATDKESGGVVALKVPYIQLESDVVFHERFQREEAIGLKLDHDRSRIMLCGNPEMVEDSRRILTERGYRVSRRGDPGHLAVENYW